MGRVYNFSAGPAVLPEEVLREAADEMLDYKGTGMSVMEMSHRSAAFKGIIEEAEADLRELMNIPDNYHVLFLQGGATQQFAAIPMNLMLSGKADYIVSGSWSKKAYKEAKIFGDARLVASSEDENFSYIPNVDELEFDPEADYVYICENETIYGTHYHKLPDTGDVPLVSDVSSCFLSEPIDVSKYGLIYGGVQKNIGPAGAVAVIARKKFIEGRSKALHSMLNYETHLDNGSLYNTPPAFAVYIVGKVAKWLKAQGGLVMMEQRNAAKAKIVYDVIDMYPDFFRGFAKTDSRSLMNVTFGLPTETLEKRFAAEAEELGMGGLKGHRSVGGLRASIYNAMPLAGCEKLAEFMEAFYKMHK